MSAVASMSALDEFNAALSRYLIWTSKGQGPATEDRARKVRFELFRVFRKIALTPAKLRGEISALDFEFRRRLDPKTGKALSPEKEVAARIRSLRFLSISWLFTAWKTRREGQSARYTATARGQKTIGEAIVNTSVGTASPYVELASFLEGVLAQNRERNLIDAALRNQSADMAVYIARKHAEFLQGTFKKTYAVAGTVTVR